MQKLNPKSIIHKVKGLFGSSKTFADVLTEIYKSNRPRAYRTQQRAPDIQLPQYPVSMYDIQYLARECDIIRMCTTKIQMEVFRRGYSWEPVNPMIKSPTSEYELVDRFFQNCNKNQQSLIDVLRKVEDDLNIFDDAYIVLIKDYVYDKKGDIVKEDVTEIIRGNPIYIKVVSDDYGNLGGKYKVCLKHRSESQPFESSTCRFCGRKLYDVHYVSTLDYGRTKVENYYIKGEIIHANKYETNLIYGYSPVVTFWRKAHTLIFMDKYAQDYYQLQRPPKGILEVPTRNQESLEKFKLHVENERSVNPNYIPWLATDPESKKNLSFVNFAESMNEASMIDLRHEYRERISGFYGVSPVMQGDVSVGGGLNNEGMQFAVTNRAVEHSQRIQNETLLPQIIRNFNVGNWRPMLKPSEEEDEASKIQRTSMHLDNAMKAAQLGLKVDFTDGIPHIQDGEASAPYAPGPFDHLESERTPNMTSGLPDKPKNLKNRPKKKNIVDIGWVEGEEVAKDYISEAAKYIALKNMFPTFEGLDQLTVRSVQNILRDSFLKGGDALVLRNLTNKMVDVGVSPKQAETISRTELTALNNTAREFGYKMRDPEGLFRFRWMGPSDDRTSELCEAIKKRVGPGKSLTEIKNILREESKRYNGEAWVYRDFVPHINCRHRLIRVIK